MSGSYIPGGNQGGPAGPYDDATARELSSLKQALDHLAAVERDLENQRIQLQTQIKYHNEQATSAYQAGRYDLMNDALAKAAQAQPELARVQEQMGRVVARQREITSRQFELLRQTNIGQAAATWPQSPSPRKPKKRRRVLIGLSIALAALVLTSLGLAAGLRPTAGSQHPNTTQAHANPTPSPTPIVSPTPVPQEHPFQPDGTGPTTLDCERALGAPCYSPEQIQQAFSLTSLYKLGYDGRGQTIVILGAGNTTTLENDLKHFDHVWGLPDPPSFKIIQESGPPAPYTCPDGEDDLQIENTLDVEWAHSIAPGANIILLLGSNGSKYKPKDQNCSFYGLEETLNYAIDNQLGQVITISYGGSEIGVTNDFYLREDSIIEDAVMNGITILASSGDSGATNPDNSGNSLLKKPNVSWPASDPYILAVGGTTLQLRNSSGAYGSERVWNDGRNGGAAGGGRSAVFPEPVYQFGVSNQSMFQGQRGIPDVSFPAEPSFDLYASFESGVMGKVNPGRWKHWDIIGGTSASSPCWAGLIAIANQLRGKPVGFVQPALYRLSGKGMHDITSGNNSYGGVPGFSARPGYDLATGWGTPIANQFLYELVQEIDFPTRDCPGTAHNCS